MALMQYKIKQNPLNRNRSSSCSSPVRSRIVYQEIYSNGANTLVRSYSYDQMFDMDERGRTFQATKIQVSNFITPENKFNVEPEEKGIGQLRKLAPDFPTDKVEMAKKKTKMVNQKRVSMNATKKALAFILLTAASACALYFFMEYRECNYVWDLEKTESDLMNNVFGQNQALKKINSVLKACNSSNDMYVMIFTGSVGVGKTYSSSIISHNFPWSSNKLLTHTELFAADLNKLLNEKLLPCGCNLVIVDDLTVKTTKEAISLISLLKRKRKQNEKLLIILIFQSYTEADNSIIVEEFKNAYINFDYVPFKPLTEDAIEKCFNAEIERLGVEIPHEDLRKLIKDMMKHIDIVGGPSGCKGVSENVAFYFKTYGESVVPDLKEDNCKLSKFCIQ